jgi:hypothetical protein
MAKTTKTQAAKRSQAEKDLETRRVLARDLRRARDERKRLITLAKDVERSIAKSDATLEALGIKLRERYRFEPVEQVGRVIGAAPRAPRN